MMMLGTPAGGALDDEVRASDGGPRVIHGFSTLTHHLTKDVELSHEVAALHNGLYFRLLHRFLHSDAPR